MAIKKIVEQLVTELTADGAKMRAEMIKSIKDTEKWGARVTSIAKVSALSFAAAGVTAGAGLAVLTRAAIDNADAMGEQAEMLGTTTERLSGLTYAAHMSAVGQEDLLASLGKLTKVSADAFKGVGKGVEAFDILGVSVTDADGKLKDSTVLLDELSEKFSSLPDGPAKAALAMDIFGKSGQKLVPLLNQGREGIAELIAEAERLGLVISTDTAQQAGQFNDQMDKLGFAVDGLGLRIAKSALPALNELTSVISDPATQEGLATFANGIISIGSALINATASAASFMASIQKEVSARQSGVRDDVETLTNKLEGLQFARDKAGWYRQMLLEDEKLASDVTLIDKEIEKTQSLISALKDKNRELDLTKQIEAEISAGLAKEGDPSLDPKAIEARWKKYQQDEEAKKANEKATADLLAQEKQLTTEYLNQSDAYRRSLTLVAESTELQKLHYEIAFGGLQGINKERREELELMARQVDAQAEANIKAEERKELEDLLMTDAERINKLWDERIAKIKELSLSEGEATEMIAKAEAARGEELKNATKEKTDEMSEFTKQAARNMQSAFADFLFDPFEDGLDGMLKSFGKTLQRMAAEAAAAAIFNSVGQWGADNSKSGGWIGTAASIASMLGGAYAEGGRPPMGKISVVGDGGEPELFVPDTAGTIVPFSKLGGGGTSVSIGSMVFPGVTNANEARRAAGAAGRELLGVMSAAQRYA